MENIESIKYSRSPVKGGYTDNILRVDLDTRSISTMELAPEFKDKYIGGRGYALKMIWDWTTEKTLYDSPENILIMAGGPLCGDPRFPGSGKFVVGTISPLTETFIDSNIGGHFAPLLKSAGFDAIAISGVSKDEVVIVIDGDEGRISINKAPMFDKETDMGGISYGESLLNKFTKDSKENIALVTTGFGAKNSRFGIINSIYYDQRRGRVRAKQAGRGGTGTVMRQKGLKAVIVKSSIAGVKANNPIDGTGVKKAGSSLKKVISQVDSQQLHLAAWGTTVLVEYMNQFHILPINNYQYGQNPESERIFANVFLDRYFSKNIPDGCFSGCNLACAKGAENVTLTTGPQKGKNVGIDGPEYESIAAVSCMGIFDPQFIMDYSWYCDEYGLDTISMGVTASFLMECFQRGYLGTKDVGYELKWGDIKTADRLLHETAKGIGFGRVCGQGVHRAKKWVAEKHAERSNQPVHEIMAELDKFGMEVKGLEFSMYITKESLAQQGGYGFALKGPQHDEAWLIFIDQVHKEIPTFEMKAAALKWFPLIRTWFNAVGLCKLPWIDVRHPDAANTENPAQNIPTLEYYVRYLNSTTGSNKTVQDVLNDSERIQLLQKLINLRQGKGTRSSDQIPLRAMTPVYINEYQGRVEYYDEWLKEQTGGKELPKDQQERLDLIIELRQKAYQRLCDAVYKEKGYSSDAIPLPETVEKFGLMDNQAMELMVQYGLVERERLVSN